MRCLRYCFLPVLVCICLLPARSQDAAVLHIGVPPLRAGTNKVSPVDARDQLVKALNHAKADRKGKVRIQAVALSTADPGKLLTEARDTGCEFVLSTRLTDLNTSERFEATSLNGGGMVVPSIGAKVAFELVRVVDHLPVGNGVATTEKNSSPDDAVKQAITQVAGNAVALLKKGDMPPLAAATPDRAGAANKQQPAEVQFLSPDYCKWLPSNTTHADALRGVCEYAMSLPTKMPNFICDQQTSRYRGDNRVPRDLITALVRYEDGNESYSEIKYNGQPAPSAISDSPGLWSTGEFGSNLRAVFDLRNQPIFEYSGENTLAGRTAWVFTYRIVKQNDPLWRLRAEDEMLAPPYDGELWIDEKTGGLLRFRSVAKNIPEIFPTQKAELSTDYSNVTFTDGTGFVLPVQSTVATQMHGEEPTRNVLEFRNCHKFRARAQILVNMPGSTAGPVADSAASENESLLRERAEAEQLYAILREKAIRDDDAAVEAERRLEMNVATVSALSRLARMEKIREKRSEQIAANTPAAHEPAIETTLKVSVRLVPVTVVLRDSKGNAVGDFRKENFSLFDNGAPQPIKSFTVEQAKNSSTPAPALQRTEADSTQPLATDSSATPGRYVAYLFDDNHTSFEDLSSARTAASHRVNALRPEDRIAIVTTSGQVFQGFTSDRGKLDQALQSLRPHPINHGPTCPPISPHMADLIVNQGDREALGLATRDAFNCTFSGMGTTPELARAEQIAKSVAFEVLTTSASEDQAVLSGLRNLVSQMGHMPGSRSIVLVSPGFLTPEVAMRQGVTDLIETALRSEIVVNTLDVRGLYTPLASPDSSHPANPAVRFRYDREEASGQGEVLSTLAYSTGGTFFHNSNDLDEGFRRTTEPPEYVYILGFSPAKLDGKYHKLKVRLNTQSKLTVQAREGYYALKPAPEPAKPGNPQ